MRVSVLRNRDRSRAHPYLRVVARERGAFGSPPTANRNDLGRLTYLLTELACIMVLARSRVSAIEPMLVIREALSALTFSALVELERELGTLKSMSDACLRSPAASLTLSSILKSPNQIQNNMAKIQNGSRAGAASRPQSLISIWLLGPVPNIESMSEKIK